MLKAMLLAAGVGTRLDPLTTQVPKPMVPVANTPVMEHILKLLKTHGINQVYANLHYLPEKITDYFEDGARFGTKLTFKHELNLSGDAGGVRACRDFLDDGTFIVVMGDLLTDADLSAVVAQHKAKGALASIAIKQMEDVSHFGVVVMDEEGFITGFQEKPKLEEALSNMISTGIYVLEPEVFKHIPETGEFGFGRQLFPQLVKNGLPVLGVEITSYWSDVGTIPQYRQSNCDALSGHVRVDLPGSPLSYESGLVAGRNGHSSGNGKGREREKKESHLWLGKNAEIGTGVDFEGSLMVGEGSVIESGVTIKGCVVVGDNCVIEKGSRIENTVIWSNSRIERGARLRSCVLGFNSYVERDAEHEEETLVAPAFTY